MSTQQEKLKAIADKIREKTGITDLIVPNEFVDKINDVYEAAKETYGLKHTVVGNPVIASYINPNTHVIKIKTSKPNTVVKKYGKNLIPYPYTLTTHSKNGLDFIDNGDGTITINGTATADTDFYFTSDNINTPLFKIDKNTSLILSGCPSNSGQYYLYTKILLNDSATYTYPYDTGSSRLIFGIEGLLRSIFIKIKSGTNCNNLIFSPQLEINSQKTQYETGIQPETYTSNSEGYIENIPIINYNIMTFNSIDNINIECEYFKDKEAEYEEFWDKFQNYGSREEYCMAFSQGWSDETFRPKYNIICGNSYNGVYNIFQFSKINNIAECLNKAGVIFDTSKCTNCSGMFNNSNSLVLPPVDLSSCTYSLSQTFYNTKAIEITVKNLKASLSFNNTFAWNSNLVTLNLINCEIGQNGFNIQHSKKLSAISLYGIISALQDTPTITSPTITLPNTAEANYNANPPEGAPTTWAELIATKPNWTIAYA